MRSVALQLSIVAVLASPLPAPAEEDERPMALVRMADARAKLHTAVVECEYEIHILGADDQLTDPRLCHFATARLAGDDVIWVNKGSPEGMDGRDAAGTPRPRFNGPHHFLFARGEKWFYNDGELAAELYPTKGIWNPPNFRTLGVVAGTPTQDVELSIWGRRAVSPTRTYREEREGPLLVITVERGNRSTKWWIDPDRGWSPVRVQRFHEGELFTESRSTLRQFDGVWFPEKVEIFIPAYMDGKVPRETFKILSAEFNRPEHPQRFTPADIGVPPGAMVKLFDESESEIGFAVWNGTELLHRSLYDEWKRAQEENAATDGTPDAPLGVGTLTEWERYTQEFIDRYKLDAHQRQAAWIICREAQAHARPIVSVIAREIIEMQQKDLLRSGGRKAREADASAPDRVPSDPSKSPSGAVKALEARMATFLEKTFEARLKRRLEELPTRAQRRAAGPVEEPSGPGDRP